MPLIGALDNINSMAGAFSKNSFKKIATDLAAALSWFRTLGIEPRRTRVGAYHRDAELLVSAYEGMKTEVLASEFPIFLNMFFEVHELIFIHKSMAGRYDNEVRAHAKHYSAGPRTYLEENPNNSSNRARNIGFKLALMATLARAGIDLDFSTEADVGATFANRRFMFECKRPQTITATAACVKDALKQLDRRYQTTARTRSIGIIALDIPRNERHRGSFGRRIHTPRTGHLPPYLVVESEQATKEAL